ncbi:MAG: hypothetical protein LBS99_04180 [Clostridiales bacterium]|nr:hypothetical protein [Clostridiales bacterium]
MKKILLAAVCLCIAASGVGMLAGCGDTGITHAFDGADVTGIVRITCGDAILEDAAKILQVYGALNAHTLTKDTVSLESPGVERDSATLSVAYTSNKLGGTAEKTIVIYWTLYEKTNLVGTVTENTRLYRKSGLSTYSVSGIDKDTFMRYFE